MKKRWFVVYIKENRRHKIAAMLDRRHIQNFCPVDKGPVPAPKHKTRLFSKPLFPAFLFVKVSEAEAVTIGRTKGVINFVYWINHPVTINDLEMEYLCFFTERFTGIGLIKTHVNPHDKGSMVTLPALHMDYDNMLVAVRTPSCKLSLPALGYVLTAASSVAQETMPESAFFRRSLVYN